MTDLMKRLLDRKALLNRMTDAANCSGNPVDLSWATAEWNRLDAAERALRDAEALAEEALLPLPMEGEAA